MKKQQNYCNQEQQDAADIIARLKLQNQRLKYNLSEKQKSQYSGSSSSKSSRSNKRQNQFEFDQKSKKSQQSYQTSNKSKGDYQSPEDQFRNFKKQQQGYHDKQPSHYDKNSKKTYQSRDRDFDNDYSRKQKVYYDSEKSRYQQNNDKSNNWGDNKSRYDQNDQKSQKSFKTQESKNSSKSSYELDDEERRKYQQWKREQDEQERRKYQEWKKMQDRQQNQNYKKYQNNNGSQRGGSSNNGWGSSPNNGWGGSSNNGWGSSPNNGWGSPRANNDSRDYNKNKQPLKMYEYSFAPAPYLKGKIGQNRIQLSEQNSIATKTYFNQDSPFYHIFIDGKIDKKGCQIRFCIDSLNQCITLGICIKSRVIQLNHKYSQKIGHGSYLLNSKGHAFSHTSNKHNDIHTQFQFSQGDYMRIQLRQRFITFIKQDQDGGIGQSYQMPIDLTEKEWKQVCFCARLYAKNDSLRILNVITI